MASESLLNRLRCQECLRRPGSALAGHQAWLRFYMPDVKKEHQDETVGLLGQINDVGVGIIETE